MIVYSNKRYLIPNENIITLGTQEEFIYVHRDIYDLAVVLTEQYETMDKLAEQFTSEDNMDAVALFYTEAPKPLNILAPYLTLIDEEIEETIEACCGRLHYISTVISMSKYIKVNPEIRREVNIFTIDRLNYKDSWNLLIKEWLPYDEVMERLTNPVIPIVPIMPAMNMQLIPMGAQPFAGGYPDMNQNSTPIRKGIITEVKDGKEVQVLELDDGLMGLDEEDLDIIAQSEGYENHKDKLEALANGEGKKEKSSQSKPTSNPVISAPSPIETIAQEKKEVPKLPPALSEILNKKRTN